MGPHKQVTRGKQPTAGLLALPSSPCSVPALPGWEWREATHANCEIGRFGQAVATAAGEAFLVAALEGSINDSHDDYRRPAAAAIGINSVPWQVRCIQAHIAANMHRVIRTADLAATMGWSAYRIRQLIKSHSGGTPRQYVMHRRVERTQRLLLISDDPLSQIAAECGFGSQSYFSKVFQKMVGERPDLWRRVRRGELRDRVAR